MSIYISVYPLTISRECRYLGTIAGIEPNLLLVSMVLSLPFLIILIYPCLNSNKTLMVGKVLIAT